MDEIEFNNLSIQDPLLFLTFSELNLANKVKLENFVKQYGFLTKPNLLNEEQRTIITLGTAIDVHHGAFDPFLMLPRSHPPQSY